jgi:hypothetical protein
MRIYFSRAKCRTFGIDLPYFSAATRKAGSIISDRKRKWSCRLIQAHSLAASRPFRVAREAAAPQFRRIALKASQPELRYVHGGKRLGAWAKLQIEKNPVNQFSIWTRLRAGARVGRRHVPFELVSAQLYSPGRLGRGGWGTKELPQKA